MSSDEQKVREQVSAWRSDLISMSRRNKLLYFTHTKTSTLEIVQPSPNALIGILESRRHRLDFYDPRVPVRSGDGTGQQPRGIEPKDDEAVAHVRGEDGELVPATPHRLRAIQRSLRRAATQEYLEKGLHSLYLAAGILKWVDPRDETQPCYAPLLLIPVELRDDESTEPNRLYSLTDEDPVVNPALAIKMESDFNLKLPAIEDYSELDALVLQKDVRRLISKHAGWEVQDRAVLGRFAYHKDVMYKDLLENEEVIAQHEFVRALVDGTASKPDHSFEMPPDEYLDDSISPEQMFSVRPADSSQRKCIWAAAQGKSFVMDGPPGTGKSQTIVNMISELVARGKTVLFVSEKAAALEVVHNRLQEDHLHEYVLQLHSHKATRREVAQDLGRALRVRQRLEERMAGSRVDTLKRLRQSLNEYAAAINEERQPLGTSLHWAIGRLAQLHEAPASDAVVDVDEHLKKEVYESILAAASRLGRAWGPVEKGDSFLWRSLASVGISMAERRSLEDSLTRTHNCLIDIRELVTDIADSFSLPPAESISSARQVDSLLRLLTEARSIPSCWLTEGIDAASKSLDELAELQKEYGDASEAAQTLLGAGAKIESLDGIQTRLEALLTQLRSLSLPFGVDRFVSSADLHALNGEWATLLDDLGSDLASEMAEVHLEFNVDVEDPTLGVSTALLELLALADCPDRPEAVWLDPATLAALKDARAVLGTAVDSYREMRTRVDAVFNEKIMDIPAADLALRFKSVHMGARKGLPAHFRDRKLLKPACRQGRVTQDAIDMLESAAQLQEIAARIRGLGREHGAKFGSYFRSTDTDFSRVDRAIDSADKALNLVSRRLELAEALPHLSNDVGIDPKIRLKVSSLRERIGRLNEFAATHLLIPKAAVDECTVSEAMSAIRDGKQLLAGLLGLESELHSHDAHADKLGDMLDGLSHVESALKASRRVESLSEKHSTALQHYFAGLDTDVDAARVDLEWTEKLIELIGGPVSESAALAILAVSVNPGPLGQLLERWDESADAVRSVFVAPRDTSVREVLEGHFGDANDLLVGLLSSIEDITEWKAYEDALQELEDQGLTAITEFCIRSRVSADQVKPVIERRVLEAWVDATIASDNSRLAQLRSKDRDSLVQQFQELDTELVRLAPGLVMEACNNRRPQTSLGAAAIIHREAQKKKRHMPIRELLRQTKEVVLSVKPCFMMSPLSVSQFLTPEFQFDVVIFDEASQIRPHDAINCIYRGRQHVIAGDQQQLPPTSFFDTHADDGDDWVEDQLEQYESVLDKVKASGTVASHSLEWHYRSQHEDLIAFSNHNFYGGQLVTFPSPKDAAPPLGVGFNYVENGVYRRGGNRDNPREAQRVAEIVADYVRNYPDLSIGVVAFSQAQEMAIDHAIADLRLSDPSIPTDPFSVDRLDGFFVKNLETVQGDERDVIVLSVGYGRDDSGKLTMAFGPINYVGGYRRLNVAVTRARLRLELVSSIRAMDMTQTSGNEGVNHLRNYLEYAELGPQWNGDRSEGGFESPFEEEVARTIESWGYHVVPQVGSAGYRVDLGVQGLQRGAVDLGVRNPSGPGGFALGIECDGARYHSSATARDRDRLREQVLRGLGWRLHRIWGPAWYRERSSEEARLRKAIEEAIVDSGVQDTHVAQRVDPTPQVTLDESEVIDSITDVDWLVDYQLATPQLTAMDQSMELGNPSAQPVLWRVIPQVVEIEQPIHRSTLLERIRTAWGSGRSGNRIQSNFDMALHHLESRSQVRVDDDGFVWKTDSDSVLARRLVRKPVADDPRTDRDAKAVSQEELSVAVQRVSELVPGVTRDELSKHVSALFGWVRRGSDIAAAVDQAIDVGRPDLS